MVSLDKTNEHFRLLYDVRGRFAIHRIQAEEAKYKLCKVKAFELGAKKVPYVVTHDGRTIRYPDPAICKVRRAAARARRRPLCGASSRAVRVVRLRCAAIPWLLLPSRGARTDPPLAPRLAPRGHVSFFPVFVWSVFSFCSRAT